MSDGELVGAYLEGRISRRTLIRRLVATGVSMGAAVSYAHVLKPERAAAQADSDHYPDTSVKLVVERLNRVVNQGRLIVRVKADEDAELRPLGLRAYRLKNGIPYTYLGGTSRNFTGPRVANVAVPLIPQGVADLDGRSSARISLRWLGEDRDGKFPNGVDVARFET